ncbi:polysaccharide biosynthesis protein [Methanococcoides methylutens]|uniref:Polysaccharide biosynthesis protein n=1 Tax=Methanococcoides methylutens TaxID=2226 RepID=A0A099T234_METMT|nr:flippase [Methanococcoides methylutens]KGK99157.1 polysaccharide biosynthesis protein [Methanococcoides methylutens]
MFSLKLSKTMMDVQWAFVSLATASFAHLLLRMVLGRELGPSGLGVYTLVFTVYMFGMQFAAFGIGSALTKYVAEFNEDLSKRNKFISSGIVGSLIYGSLMGLLLYLLSDTIGIGFFHNPDIVGLLRITALCLPFIALQKAVVGTLNGLRSMKLYAFVNIIQNVSVMVVSIVFVIPLNMAVKGAVIGFVLPTIVVGLLSLIIVRTYFTAGSTILGKALKELSWFGFYIVLANSVGLLNTEIDSLLIGHYLNEVEVGYYAVAVILVQGLSLIPMSVHRITYAASANYYVKNDYENLSNLLKNSFLKVFLVTMLISAVLVLFGQFIIRLLFGEDFLFAYKPLLVLLIGYSLYYPIHSITSVLSGMGKVTLVFRIALLCGLTNILLNILLIPEFGILGAAIATSIGLIFAALVRAHFIYKYTKSMYG